MKVCRTAGLTLLLLTLGPGIASGAVLVLEAFAVDPSPQQGISYDQDGKIRAQNSDGTSVYNPSDLSFITGYGNSSGVIDSGAGINDGVVTNWQLNQGGIGSETRQNNNFAVTTANLSAYHPVAIGDELQIGGEGYLMFIGQDGVARAIHLATAEVTPLLTLPNPNITGGNWYLRKNGTSLAHTGVLVTYGDADYYIGHFPSQQLGARNSGELLDLDSFLGTPQDITSDPNLSKLYLVYSGDQGVVAEWSGFTPYEPIPPTPGVVTCQERGFSGTNRVVEVRSEGAVGFTHAVELSKNWPVPGTWEKIGEIEQSNTVSTAVLNLSTNLPPRVHLRLKWPP